MNLPFDLETTGDPTCAEWLDPIQPPANYKDEAKIAAYVAEKTAERAAKLALDPDCCRIVCLGYGDTVTVCPDTDVEWSALSDFWRLFRECQDEPDERLVGYNCVAFDLPVLIQRSRILNVPAPRIDLKKWGCPDVIDLMLLLSHGGLTGYKSLSFWCRRLGIDVPDDSSGKDIAGMVAAGEWDRIVAHCRADLVKTKALADRIL